MEKDSRTNTYEEARKQMLLENKKRFEDLGILSISKSLSDISKSEKKSQPRQRQIRQKQENVYSLEPRRSSRERNPVPTYRDDVDVDLPRMRKRAKWDSSWASYLARPLEEVRTASFEERADALKSAEKLQSNLQSENPSFIKSMVRSHVYSCFWLGLPTRFCEEYLPKSTVDMVLEDEEGSEYDAVFISKRTGLSGGWRAFALDHKLDDGDAVVFELVEPTRFKVYIVRAFYSSTKDNAKASEPDSGAEEAPEEATKSKRKKNGRSKVTSGSEAEEAPEEATNSKIKNGRSINTSVSTEDNNSSVTTSTTVLLRRSTRGK